MINRILGLARKGVKMMFAPPSPGKNKWRVYSLSIVVGLVIGLYTGHYSELPDWFMDKLPVLNLPFPDSMTWPNRLERPDYLLSYE